MPAGEAGRIISHGMPVYAATFLTQSRKGMLKESRFDAILDFTSPH